jgi:hypothetical protein
MTAKELWLGANALGWWLTGRFAGIVKSKDRSAACQA